MTRVRLCFTVYATTPTENAFSSCEKPLSNTERAMAQIRCVKPLLDLLSALSRWMMTRPKFLGAKIRCVLAEQKTCLIIRNNIQYLYTSSFLYTSYIHNNITILIYIYILLNVGTPILMDSYWKSRTEFSFWTSLFFHTEKAMLLFAGVFNPSALFVWFIRFYSYSLWFIRSKVYGLAKYTVPLA